MHARARFNPRCGAVAAWFSDPSPVILAKRSTRKPGSLRKALSERLKAGDVLVVDDLKLGSPKTKEITGVLTALDLKGSALIVSQETDRNLTLASRNVANVMLTTCDLLNTYDVLRPDKLVFTKGAFEKVEARLAKE